MAGKGSKQIVKEIINFYKINRNGYPYEIIYKLSRLIQTLEDVYSVSNATELQEAIDSIGDGAGTIFFASGTHTISSTINISTGGTIIIFGHGDNTILMPDAGIDAFNVTDGMVIIEKLKLDLSNYIAGSKGIIINEINDKVSIVESITITGDGVNGYGIELSSNNCRINNCNINNVDYGINVLSNDNILSGNNCDNCATYGVNIDGDYNNLIANIIDTNGVGVNLTINADSNRIRENRISGNTIQWVDNGVNNDIEYRCTTATDIQDAVDSIGDKSGVVVLLNKTYTLTGTINLNGGGLYFIRGEGEGSIIDCGGDWSAFYIDSAKEGTTLSHFKIDANDLTSLLKEIINVNEGSDNKIICENLIITGDGTHGLGVSLSSDNCRVANCFFEKIKAGVFTSNSANNIISENICKNCDNGINNYFGSDCIITGNVCSNNTIGIFNDRSTNSTIVENTCNHNERYGIFNYGSSDCTITGNACNGNNTDDVSDGAGIQLTDDCDYNTIAGNSCNNNANTGAGTAYGININTIDCNNNVIGINSMQNNDVDYSDSGTGTILFGDNTVYGISWDNDLGTATKNAIYDKMQLIIAGAAANAFKTINTPAGTNPVADAVDDTLNITATGDITITGNAGTDTVDFSVTKYTNAEAIAAVVAENPLALTNSLKIGGNDILDFGDNVILSSNGLGVIDALGNLSCNIVFTGAQTIDGVDISSIVAFKTITGITNDVVADLLTDTLTLAAAGGLTIVGTTATDTITFTNTITQYTDVLAKAAVAADDKYIRNYENDSTTGNLTVANLITVGLVDGVDVSDLKADVDGFNDRLKFLAEAEIQQLENIGAELISAAEWGFVASLQDVASGASPNFNRITINNVGTVNSDAVRYDQLTSMIAGLNWQESIIDNDLNAPPGGEGVGDRYIVAAGGAGAWNGHDDDIAEYNGVGWDFFTPEDGWTVWVVDEDTNFTWNGVAWVEFGSTISHNNTTGLQGGAPGEYNHITDAQHGALHAIYTDVAAVAAVATADDYIKNDANDVMNGDLTVNNLITAGNVDGVDISALSITNMPTAVNNWKMYATNAAGVMTELAVGAAGQFLIGNGVAAAPSFQAQPAPVAHVHDGDTLQLDGINSNLGAFPFTTAGTVTFNQAVTIQGLLTADGLVPEADLADSLGTAALTWLDLFVQDIKDAAGNVILSNDGAGNIDALGNLSCNIVFTGAQTVDGVDISSIVAFKTITGITNDVVADSLTDTLTFVAAGGLTIVGTAATDTITFTNTITQYTNADALSHIEATGIDFDTTITLGFVDDVGGVFVDRIYDEDNMVSNDEHGLITQQSAKKYTDDRLYDIGFSHNWGGIVDKAPTVDKVYDQFIEVANEMTAIKYCLDFQGVWDASGGAAPNPAPADGDYWIVTTAGVWDAVTWELLDWIVWENNTEKWYKVKYFRQTPKVLVKPTDSIQTAIDKVIHMGGGIVEIQSGTFNDGNDAFPLNINDAGAGLFLKIIGIGSSTIIDPNADSTVFNITNIGKLVLEDFKIDANDLITPAKEIINITEANNNPVIVERITIVGDGTNGYGIEINSKNCKIENCDISSVNIGINVLGNDNTVQENAISSCNTYGIQVKSNNNSLYDNESDNNAVGIYLDTADYNQINGNYIEGNTLNGIHFNSSNYNALNDNYCIGNDSNTVNPQGGIVIDADSDNNTIISNTSINNNNIGAGTLGYGIYIGNANCNKNIVHSNNISGNDFAWKDLGTNSDFEYKCSTNAEIQDAIDSIAAKTGIIEILSGNIAITIEIDVDGGGNYIIKGQGDGTVLIPNADDVSVFYITNAKSCLISDLKVDMTAYTNSLVNDNYSIWIDEVAENQCIVERCTFVGDGTNGVGILLQSNNSIVRNCIATIIGYGIFVSGNYNSCESNLAYTCSEDGLNVTGNYNTFNDNLVYNNTGNGLFLSGFSNVLTGNISHTHTTVDKSGIYIDSGDKNTITGNTCYGNYYGIYMVGANNSTITGNNLVANVTDGIFINGSNYSTITGNNCSSVGRYGIYCYSLWNSSISSNNCSDIDADSAVNGGGIYLDEICDYNTIIGNTCNNNNNIGIGDHYGIIIVDANCDENIIAANKMAGNDTDYSDTGTGTILFGDNTAYGAGWENDLGTATKHTIWTKIEAVIAGIPAAYTDADVDARIVVQNTDPAGTIDIAIDALINTHNAADNHIAHSGVIITAGVGLSGGGTIAANRTIDCDITQYTDAMVDARIVIQNTDPAGTIDIAIDALIAGLVDAAGAVQAVEDAGLVLAQDKTISFDAEQNDTTYSGICIDIDTTGCNTYDLVYCDASDSVLPADATDDTKMPAIGIVVAAGKVLISGVVKDDDLIVCTTGGAVVYASTILRKVTETAPSNAGEMIQVVGICVGDHSLYVNISLDMVEFVV